MPTNVAPVRVPRTAPEILDREFLEVRARLLQVAAALDRLDRADGTVAADPRRQKLAQALDLVAADGPGRAEKLQRLFSREYAQNWQTELNLETRR